MTITVVAGPPAGGKSTYVAGHAGPADAIVDLDRLALALAHPDTEHHAYPDHIRRAAIAARHAAIRRLAHDPAVPHLWVIHGRPSVDAVRHYLRLGATIIVVDPGERVVRSRAHYLRPHHTAAEVDRWYRTPPVLPHATHIAGDRDTTIA